MEQLIYALLNYCNNDKTNLITLGLLVLSSWIVVWMLTHELCHCKTLSLWLCQKNPIVIIRLINIT